jgi:hypothetical protein
VARLIDADPTTAQFPGTRNLRLRVLLRKDDDWWVARCLEHDIAVQARDLATLQYELGRVLLTHALFDLKHDRAPFHAIPPVPPEVEHRWSSGIVAVLETPRFSADIPIPRIQFDARVVS